MTEVRPVVPGPKPPPMKVRLLRALADGLEAAPEIADELDVTSDHATVSLNLLWRQGVIDRERRPTFYLHGESRHAAYRYRVKDPCRASC